MNWRWFLAPGVLLLTVACGGSGGDEASWPSTGVVQSSAAPTLPPIATRAPQPSATPVNAYPPGTRTGVAVIDAALAALESGDAALFTAQLSFHPYRCDNAPAGVEGSNPCPPGVAEGSPVEVIAFGSCKATFVAREDAGFQGDIESYVSVASEQGTYAVTEVQEGRLASPLPLRYLVILSRGFTLLLDDAGVTHIGLPCGAVGPAQLYHPADRPILPPL